MSDLPGPDLFAPQAGWRVRIRDLSGGAEDGIVEEIGGFGSLMHANAFASRYVRDSVELCRARGMDAAAVLGAWLAFGEDAEVIDAGEAGWRSADAVRGFAEQAADAEARNWRALDPRKLGGLDADDDDAGDPA